MTNCKKCVHLIKYPEGGLTCWMKQEFCMVRGKNTYPKDCEYYEKIWIDALEKE